MEIQRLKSEIIANIRSSSTINNVTQCVTELVLNSLDSKSTSIAVRVNLVTFKVQVVDNGGGITKTNLEHVGLRYMTNKCDSLVHLERHIKYHGFRGEALASIINISKKVNITSKHTGSTETYSKNFGKHTDNRVVSVNNRPSFGTTVTVEGLLINLPVRRNRVVPELELEDLKRNIESLIIIYPNVSFSVRNEVSGNLIINSQKTKDIISSFKRLHSEIDEEFSLMKVSKDKVTIEGVLFKGLFANKHLQFVYVNRRPVRCSKIQKLMSNLFFKSGNFDGRQRFNGKIASDKKYPVYVINVKCPHSQVDILLNPSKTLVEFKNWTIVLQCLEKLVCSFFGSSRKRDNASKHLPVRREIKSGGGVSQIYGAVKSFGYKRKRSAEDCGGKNLQRLGSQNSDIIEESCELAKKSRPDFVLEDVAVDENFASSQKRRKCEQNDRIALKPSIESERNCIGLDGELKEAPVDKIKINVDKPVSDNDMYSISDTTPVKETRVRRFKKPLPIVIKNKNPKPGNLRSISKRIAGMKVSPCVDNKNCNAHEETPAIQPSLTEIPKKLEDEKSTLSKFTSDENKGKNLIMDMFLKSTQVYSTEDDNRSDVRSDETILEVQSDFLLENNIQTNVNGFSKTMSMSVNIRSTKKIKKHNVKVNRKADRMSKCVQTTFNENKMSSKCIQTTIDQDYFEHRATSRHNGLRDVIVGKKPAENYTVVLSDSFNPDRTPHFRFVYQNPSRFNLEPINKLSSANDCKCTCHLNAGKIFNFVDAARRRNAKPTIDIFGPSPRSIEQFHHDGFLRHESIKRTFVDLVKEKSDKRRTDDILNNNIDIFGLSCDLNDASSIKQLHHDGFRCTDRNSMQVDVNRLVPNYKRHPNNVLYESYQPLKRDNREIGNYDIRRSARNTVQAEINRFVPNYEQQSKPVSRIIPNLVKERNREGFVSRQKRINKNLQVENKFGCDRSPYFLPKTSLGDLNKVYKVNLTPYPKGFSTMAPNNADSYLLFDPQYRSTQLRDFNGVSDLNCVGAAIKEPLESENFSDFTMDHFGNFQPAYKSTQHDRRECFQPVNDVHIPFVGCNGSNFASPPKLINVSEDVCGNVNPFDYLRACENVQTNVDRQEEKFGLKTDPHANIFGEFDHINSNPPIDLCPPRQAQISPDNAEIGHRPASKETGLIECASEKSELIISLSNQEKQELLERELSTERDLNAAKYLEWDSLLAVPRLQEDIPPSDSEKFGADWEKRKNNFGSSFYINKRTGFTTFFAPKPNGNQFKFGKRFEFMPRGSSPILRDVKQVDRSLNQIDKDKLQSYILESHQNELLIVKWQNYIKHNDPKTFFDEVYKEKLRLFEDCLPNVNAFDRKKYLPEVDDVTQFNKTLFESVEVIGQVDGKFIAVLDKTRNVLMLFDQHAVHERIRLEELLKVYRNAKIKQAEKLVFLVPQNDISLLKKHELYVSSLGLSVEFFANGISISEIPLCLYNKFRSNDNQGPLSVLVQLLINEIIELLKETRGVSFGNLPKIIQNIINLEACRGAIKFGDSLSKKDCTDLLGRLAVCQLPFQCAHGRPTLTPLIKLNVTQSCVPYKASLKKLHCKPVELRDCFYKCKTFDSKLAVH